MDYEEARKESWYDQMKSTMIGGHDVRANGGYELLERSTNVVMARAAFEKAVELYPNDRILLQQGARIIAKSTELDPTPGRARQSMVDNYSKTRGRIRPQAKSQNLCDEELNEDSNLGPADQESRAQAFRFPKSLRAWRGAIVSNSGDSVLSQSSAAKLAAAGIRKRVLPCRLTKKQSGTPHSPRGFFFVSTGAVPGSRNVR